MFDLTKGSYPLIFLALVGSGSGLPISEDAVILGTGALADRGLVYLPFALATCMAGVLVGDFVVFSVARRLGPRALDNRYFQRIMTPARRERAEAMVTRRGGFAVFFARFLIGFRIPAFATAGALGMSPATFFFADLLAMCLSAPAVFFMGYVFSSRLEEVKTSMQSGQIILLALVAGVVVIAAALLYRSHRRGLVHDLETLPASEPEPPAIDPP